MNLLLPRIDWRGDGPGYAEMEFPIYEWTIALCYRVFGIHEIFGRVIAYLFSLGTLGLFIALARNLLPPAGAVAASLLFALSPLVVRVATTLQPEGLMLLCYIGALYYFLRWLDSGTWRSYGLALCFTALTILAKATAAHIGILFAILILKKEGLGALRQARVWLFGALSLFPAALWYKHAHHLWLAYGNSLGLSNQYHWIGPDFFTNPAFIRGILNLDIRYVWMPTGLIVAAFALYLWKSERSVPLSVYWLASISVFYILACRTTSSEWADYYHVFSAAPVALLCGVGVEATRRLALPGWGRKLLAIASAIVTILWGIAATVGFHTEGSLRMCLLFGLTTVVLVVLFGVRVNPKSQEAQLGPRAPLVSTFVAAIAALSLAATFLFQFRGDEREYRPRPDWAYRCAKNFEPLIPKGDRIVASGGICTDPDGYPVAYNAPYMFYWMDRKGFNICEGEQSIEALRALEQRGARYFVAEKYALDQKPGFETELRRSFPLVSDCKTALLFQLN